MLHNGIYTAVEFSINALIPKLITQLLLLVITRINGGDFLIHGELVGVLPVTSIFPLVIHAMYASTEVFMLTFLEKVAYFKRLNHHLNY